MSDGNENNGTSLALTEKRHGNNGGGCVGILFQLFDWHRRFAKKKLFKRRLLPSPARAKQEVQMLKGDEKIPDAKLHMITDESGWFPGVRKNGSRNLDAEQKHGTQAPGLVARLMGLESMPLVQQASRKNFKGETPNAGQEKLVVGCRVVGKEDLNVEKGERKRKSRPPKFQKTRESGRTLFGAEALQIKNVFTRSRKHHHQKLLTPVKSPRIPPANRSTSLTTSRLIDAASKILEPGLQNKNRIKCDFPYSSFVQQASEDTLAQRSQFLSPDIQTQNLESECSSYKPSMGQSSCKNCGTLLEGMDCRQNMLEQTINHFHIVPQHLDDLCHKTEIAEGRRAFTVVLPQKAMYPRRGQEESVALTSSSMGNSLAEDHNDRQVKVANPSKEYSDEWPSSRHKSNPLRDEMPVQERTMLGSRNSYLKGGRIPCSLSTLTDDKNFVNLNRSMSGRIHPRSHARAYSSGADVERTRLRRSGSTSEMKLPLQKIRSSSEHPSSASTSCTMQKSRSGPSGGGNRSRCIEDSDGVVSFTFRSPIRDKAGLSYDVKNNKQGENVIDEKKYSESKSGLGEKFSPRFQQKHLALTRDALGAILEEKSKGLTSLEEEEDMIAREMPRRPTTVILQDIIAAVTVEPSVSEYGVTADSKTTFQMKPSICDAPKVFHDANSFSPGSVLEVSFSNDSCVSSSFDDISGSKIHADFMDYSIDSTPTLVQDMELLDSATSSNMGIAHFVELTRLIDWLAGIMDGLTLVDVRFTRSKVSLVKDIILHAELVFASFSPENFKYLEGVICALLQDVCTDLKRFFSLGDAEVGSEMRAFALDCLLESFDEDCRRCCNIGYKGWARQLSSWTPEILSQDIVEKVRRWASLSGLTPDEIIENEMSHSLGKWTEFDIEAFELGAAFADDMLKDVVEEISVSILCPNC